MASMDTVTWITRGFLTLDLGDTGAVFHQEIEPPSKVLYWGWRVKRFSWGQVEFRGCGMSKRWPLVVLDGAQRCTGVGIARAWIGLCRARGVRRAPPGLRDGC